MKTNVTIFGMYMNHFLLECSLLFNVKQKSSIGLLDCRNNLLEDAISKLESSSDIEEKDHSAPEIDKGFKKTDSSSSSSSKNESSSEEGSSQYAIKRSLTKCYKGDLKTQKIIFLRKWHENKHFRTLLPTRP